jgi:hypothetical protein
MESSADAATLATVAASFWNGEAHVADGQSYCMPCACPSVHMFASSSSRACNKASSTRGVHLGCPAAFGLDSYRKDLDDRGLAIAAAQEASVKGRRQLADATKSEHHNATHGLLPDVRGC